MALGFGSYILDLMFDGTVLMRKPSQKTNKPGFIDLWSSVFWATETEMRGAAGYSLMPYRLFVLLPSLLF